MLWKNWKNTYKKYFELLFSMLKIGVMGFGGGTALIPLIYEEAVKKKQYISDEEFDEDVSIASITPGALPIEIVSGIGHRMMGWRGLFLASFGIAFPGAALTIVALLCLQKINEQVASQIHYVTIGVTAFIITLLFEYITGVVSKCPKNHRKYRVILILAVFLASCGEQLHTIFVTANSPVICLSVVSVFFVSFFLICNIGQKSNRNVMTILLTGFYIILNTGVFEYQRDILYRLLCMGMLIFTVVNNWNTFGNRRKGKKIEGTRLKDIVALCIIMVIGLVINISLWRPSFLFAAKGILSAVLSFGGGDAYLAVADEIFVGQEGISKELFYGQLVPTINLLPGSILCKTLTGIGFYTGLSITSTSSGAIRMSLLGMIVSVFVSCGIFTLMHILFALIGDSLIVSRVTNWVKPIVSGLLLTVILCLVNQTREIQGGVRGMGDVAIMMAIVLMCVYLRRKKVNSFLVILISMGSSLFIVNLYHVFL